MSEEHRDWETTTAILARRAPGLAWLPAFVRQRLSPLALWSAIVVLGFSMWYVINAQVAINHHQASIDEIQKSIAKLVEQSQDTRNDVTSIKATVNDMKENEHERWERIDKVVAEDAAHARHKR